MDIISKIALVYFVAAVAAGVVFLLFKGKEEGLQVRNLPRTPLVVYVASVVLSCFLAVSGAARDAETREPTFDVEKDRVLTVPIGVTWRADDLNEYSLALVGAMKLWNDSVGCPLFAQVAFPQQAQVLVRSYNGEPCGRAPEQPIGVESGETPGVTWPCPDGTDEIQVNRLDEIQKAYRVFAHELGHALRLAHDEPGGGIMAPAILGMTIVEPNRKDVAALRARYCR